MILKKKSRLLLNFSRLLITILLQQYEAKNKKTNTTIIPKTFPITCWYCTVADQTTNTFLWRTIVS